MDPDVANDRDPLLELGRFQLGWSTPTAAERFLA